MRVGLISDVHANLHALQAVLERLDREELDRLICLGDVVGYGGDPEACVRLVRERTSACVVGNHDAAVLEPRVRRTFNAAARIAVEAHGAWLDEESRAFLAALPAEERIHDPAGDGLFVTHGMPGETQRFTYLMSPAQARQALESFDERFGAVGHTHVPAVFEEVRETSPGRRRGDDAADAGNGTSRDAVSAPGAHGVPGEVRLSFDDGTRAILNPGSVGQPRDGDPRASCMVLDLGRGEARLLRLEYDVAGAQAAIRRRGLPEVLAARLALGR